MAAFAVERLVRALGSRRTSVVTRRLQAGEGDWPAGLTCHTGAASAGGLLVFEVWESQEARATFMNSRLGPAFGQVGLPEPARAEGLSVEGHHAQ